MSLEIDLLRALFKLSRRSGSSRSGPGKTTMRLLTLYLGEREERLRHALHTLGRAGLVQATPKGPRLSMVGLAVAAASSAPPRAKRLTGAPRLPLVRPRAA